MQYVLFGVLGVYTLPLFGIVLSIAVTQIFRVEALILYVVAAISSSYLGSLRDIFGSIIVPLVTAYSIPIRKDPKKLPAETLRLFVVLAALFVLSSISYGIVMASEPVVKTYGGSIFESFRDVTLTQTKEMLTYIALTIGITFKPK